MNILKYESPAGTKAGGLIRAIASVQDLAPSGGENGLAVPKSSSTGSSTPEVCFIGYIKLVLEFQM